MADQVMLIKRVVLQKIRGTLVVGAAIRNAPTCNKERFQVLLQLILAVLNSLVAKNPGLKKP